MKPRILAAVLSGVASAATLAAQGPPASAATPENPNAVLINTCLITDHVHRLADFYSRVLEIEAHWSGDSYVEFPTSAGVLALFTLIAVPRLARVG
jgi:hypothetical protein